MYSNRSPPTVPAGMEFPYISIPGRCGIAPSTGISLLRRYSSILGSLYGVTIKRILRYRDLEVQTRSPFVELKSGLNSYRIGGPRPIDDVVGGITPKNSTQD